ncbi:glycosyltransferase family 61 protein [uncultured Umboniibacter sp.]|uniref:glycosyltransferase family 61 protein n=1 Tax=uncultured Umboniibacter sp. TaxID=1798917 RepID=UPI002622A620|nr:glycosyltransferase family 61 protein [uncultured Umboniibacter sp.]
MNYGYGAFVKVPLEGLDNSSQHFEVQMYDRTQTTIDKFDASIHLEEVEAEGVGVLLYEDYHEFNLKRISAGLASKENRFLNDVDFVVRHQVVSLKAADIVIPNGAIQIGNSLIKDTLYMSRLFSIRAYKNDKSTGWKWQQDSSLKFSHSDQLKGFTVAFCYHRLYGQFFHWFLDCLPRLWLLQRSKVNVDLYIIPGFDEHDFISESVKVLGVDKKSIVKIDSPQTLRVDSLVFPTSYVKESQKVRPSLGDGVNYKGGWDYKYIRDVNSKFRSAVESSRVLHKRIFVDRSDSNHRQVKNHAELLSLLDRYGFHVVTPGLLTFVEQVSVFRDAEVVLGVHGAGLTNILWCKPDEASVIELVVDKLGDPGYRFIAGMLGLNYEYILTAPDQDHRHGIAFADVYVDLETLEEKLKDLGL